jgi:hypothetical protein
LIRKPEGKRPLGRLGCRWEGNIKRDDKEIAYDGVNWMFLDVLYTMHWWIVLNVCDSNYVN